MMPAHHRDHTFPFHHVVGILKIFSVFLNNLGWHQLRMIISGWATLQPAAARISVSIRTPSSSS